MLVDLHRDLLAAHVDGRVDGVELGDQLPNLLVPSLVGHRLEVAQVLSEDLREVDPTRVLAREPIAQRAARIRTQSDRLEDSTGHRRAEQDARGERCHDEQVGQRHGRIGRLVGNPHFVHRAAGSCRV